eukprot:6362860-Alexandrium_andersonii.AAC.1
MPRGLCWPFVRLPRPAMTCTSRAWSSASTSLTRTRRPRSSPRPPSGATRGSSSARTPRTPSTSRPS